jgi:DNA-binding transcriptional MerR regulator
MNNFLTISEAADICGCHIDSLKKWEQCGYIVPRYTKGGHRRYSIEDLKGLMNNPEVKLKNERFDKCKQLWDKTKELDVLATAATSKDIVVKYKAGVADFVVPILIDEVLYYKGILEEWMSLQNKIRRLGRIIEAEEKVEEFEQQQKLLIEVCKVKHLPTDEVHRGRKGGITACGFDTNTHADYWTSTTEETTCEKNGCVYKSKEIENVSNRTI